MFIINPYAFGGYDTDAQTYFSALATAGYTASGTEKSAWNSFVLSGKSNGWWSKIKVINPLIGAAAAPHAINAKNPAAYNTTWNGTLTHNANGIISDFTTGYGDLGASPATILGASNDGGLFMYVRSRTLDATFRTDFGLEQNWPNTVMRLGYPEYTTDTAGAFFDAYRDNADSSAESGAAALSFGLLHGFRITGSVTNYLYLNGSLLDSTAYATAGTRPGIGTLKILKGAANCSRAQVAAYGVTDGFTTSEAGSFYTAMQTFQTAMSRNV